jgi:hypothetical protein
MSRFCNRFVKRCIDSKRAYATNFIGTRPERFVGNTEHSRTIFLTARKVGSPWFTTLAQSPSDH